MNRLTAILLFLTLPALSAAADDRQLVELPEMMQNHMKANMRDHLAALNDASRLASQGQWDQAADQIEKRLGMSSMASHGASHMAPHMPQGMRETGTLMHKAASHYARTLQEGDATAALAAQSLVMDQCTACHSAYRIQ